MRALMITYNVYENNLGAALKVYAEAGFEVDVATSSMEAWDYIGKNKYAALIIERQGLKIFDGADIDRMFVSIRDKNGAAGVLGHGCEIASDRAWIKENYSHNKYNAWYNFLSQFRHLLVQNGNY